MIRMIMMALALVSLAGAAVAQDIDNMDSPGRYYPEIALTDASGLKIWIKSYVPFHAAVGNSNPVYYDGYDYECPPGRVPDEGYKTVGTGEYSGDIVIPDRVSIDGCTFDIARIGYGAFACCEGLTSVTLPGGLMDVRRGAFYGCTSLREVRQNPVWTDRYYYTIFYPAVFNGCTNLVKADISTAYTVFDGIFVDCPALKEVRMATDGYQLDAFRGRNCGTLEKIVCVSPNPTGEGSPFFSELEYATTTVIVPDGSLGAYRACREWNRFANIVEESHASVTPGNIAGGVSVVRTGALSGRLTGEFAAAAVYGADGRKICDVEQPGGTFTVPCRGVYIIQTTGSTLKTVF